MNRCVCLTSPEPLASKPAGATAFPRSEPSAPKAIKLSPVLLIDRRSEHPALR